MQTKRAEDAQLLNLPRPPPSPTATADRPEADQPQIRGTFAHPNPHSVERLRALILFLPPRAQRLSASAPARGSSCSAG